MLYSGGSDRGGHTDSFKTAVIDTLVAEVQSVPGDGECHLLLVFQSAELIVLTSSCAFRRSLRAPTWIQGPDGGNVPGEEAEFQLRNC